MNSRLLFGLTASSFLMIALAACGGGGGSSPTAVSAPPPATFTIGGTVTGLAAGTQIVLNDDGNDPLTVSANSTFTFTKAIALNGSYAVTVDTQPSVGACRVTNGTGTGLQANVTSVNVSCRLGIAYVANTTDSTISQYTIDGAGALTQVGTPVGTGSFPRKIAVDPTGKFAYVTNFGTDPGTPGAGATVSQYTVAADGTLTPNSSATAATGLNPYAIAIDSTGKYAYVTNQGSDTVSQFTLGADGVLTPMSTPSVPCGHLPYGLTIDPSGSHVYVANLGSSNTKGTTVSQYRIGAGGALVPMTAPLVTTGKGPLAVTVDAAGTHAYVSNFFDLTVSQFNIDASGALVPSGATNVATGADPYPVTITPNGKYAYFSNKFDDTISQCSVASTGTGVLDCSAGTISTSSTHPAQPQFIAFDPFGLYAYVVNFNTGTGGTIAKYSIGATGLLVPMAGSPTTPAGNGPFSIVTTR
jgi:DNA-binding beta-propeller fold protein YncE